MFDFYSENSYFNSCPDQEFFKDYFSVNIHETKPKLKPQPKLPLPSFNTSHSIPKKHPVRRYYPTHPMISNRNSRSLQSTNMISSILLPGDALTGYQHTWFRPDGLGTFYTISDVNGYFRYKYGTVCPNTTIDAFTESDQQYTEDNVGCVLGLSEGMYMFRVTGAEDPYKAFVSWEFCDEEGSAQEELIFEIEEDGECKPHSLRNVSDVCNPDDVTSESEGDLGDGPTVLKPKPKPLRHPGVVSNEKPLINHINPSIHSKSNDEMSVYGVIEYATDDSYMMSNTTHERPLMQDVLLNAIRGTVSGEMLEDNRISMLSIDEVDHARDHLSRKLEYSFGLLSDQVHEMVFEVRIPASVYNVNVSISSEMQTLENDLRDYLMRLMESDMMLSHVRSLAKQRHVTSLESIRSMRLLSLEVRHASRVNDVVSGVASVIVVLGGFLGVIFGGLLYYTNMKYRSRRVLGDYDLIESLTDDIYNTKDTYNINDVYIGRSV